VLGQLMFRIIAIPYINYFGKKRIAEILKKNNIKEYDFNTVDTIELTSINSKEGHDLLKKINPDIVIIVTKRIISKATLGITNAKFINIHAGITPKYRGFHGAYWALINKDKKNCGVTVHFVDEGIDTGTILYQDTIMDIMTPEDNFMSYTYLQLAKALPLLKNAISDILTNSVEIKKSENNKQDLFYHPTLWFYLYNRWFKGVK
jgi:methionyl-tRNA formyltransferase